MLILGFDAHCGGGTASLLGDEPRVEQLDVAVNNFDAYRGSDSFRLHVVHRAADYLPTIERELEAIARSGARHDLCLYNAGMDPFEGCSTGGLSGITEHVLAARERLVFDWCRGRGLPVAFVLAGGYIGAGVGVEELVALHCLTIAEAATNLMFAWRILPMRRLPAAATIVAPALAAVLLLSGCNPQPPGEDLTVTTDTTARETPAPATPGQEPAGFVNRVWRVTASSAVAPGTLYVFMAESTLVIDGPGGTPAVGTWRRDGDGLVMVEEGIAYPTDILELTAVVFRIRSHNPGQPVDITMAPADVTR